MCLSLFIQFHFWSQIFKSFIVVTQFPWQLYIPVPLRCPHHVWKMTCCVSDRHTSPLLLPPYQSSCLLLFIFSQKFSDNIQNYLCIWASKNVNISLCIDRAQEMCLLSISFEHNKLQIHAGSGIRSETLKLLFTLLAVLLLFFFFFKTCDLGKES